MEYLERIGIIQKMRMENICYLPANGRETNLSRNLKSRNYELETDS